MLIPQQAKKGREEAYQKRIDNFNSRVKARK